jgi:hypothetical protein
MKMLFFVVTSVFISCWDQIAAESGTLKVCHVLSDLNNYRNRDVQIRGEWVQTDHGMYIRGKCNRPLQTGAHRWPSSIWLQLPWLEEEETVDFTADRNVLEKAQRQAGRLLLRSRPGTHVYATFIGRLQVRERLEVRKREYAGPNGNGFGHLNAYPAQLVLRSIIEVSLMQE